MKIQTGYLEEKNACPKTKIVLVSTLRLLLLLKQLNVGIEREVAGFCVFHSSTSRISCCSKTQKPQCSNWIIWKWKLASCLSFLAQASQMQLHLLLHMDELSLKCRVSGQAEPEKKFKSEMDTSLTFSVIWWGLQDIAMESHVSILESCADVLGVPSVQLRSLEQVYCRK